jgi:hypothetical protein
MINMEHTMLHEGRLILEQENTAKKNKFSYSRELKVKPDSNAEEEV